LPYFLFSQILRDFLLAPILVLGVESAPFQILPLVVIFACFLAANIIFKPLKNKLELGTLIVNDCLYILALTSFLMYHYQKDSITEEQRYTIYGFTIIGILGAIVLANLLVGFYVCYE
jgi:hypothetical protein